MGTESEAFTISTVLDSLNKEIKTLDAWNGQVFAGLVDGTLFVLKPDSKDEKSPWQIVQARKGFGKKSIVQLQVWQEKSMMLSLDEDGVSLFKLPSLKLNCLANRSKGSQRFAWNSEKALLAVAVKRKLLLFHYNGNEFMELRDFSIPDTSLRMAWLGSSVCLGLRKEYALIHTETGAVTDLFKSATIALVSLTPSDEVLVCKGNVGLILGQDGRVARKSSMIWSDAPSDLIYSQPYAIALLPNYIEIRSVHRVSANGLAQVLPVRGLTVASPAARGDGSVFAASGADGGIKLLRPVPLHRQAECLADLEEFQEALRIASFIPDTEAKGKRRVNNVLHVRYGHRLFAEGEFDEAMAHFGMCSNANPLVLLNLFPSLASSNLLQPLQSTIAGYRLPDLPEPSGEAYQKAVEVLLPYLLSHRSRLASLKDQDVEEGHENGESERASAEESLDAEQAGSISDLGQAGLNDLDMEQRRSLEEVIDTAILKAMLATSDSGALLRFVQRENAVDLAEGETALRSAGRYSELVAHYQAHGQHSRALTLLKNISLKQEDLPVPAQGAAAELGGVTGVWAAVRYLCSLQPIDIDLVKRHARWILKADPEAGLDMFTQMGASLPTPAALSILTAQAPDLCAPYLEVSLQNGSADPKQYHNDLASIYLRIALASDAQPSDVHSESSAEWSQAATQREGTGEGHGPRSTQENHNRSHAQPADRLKQLVSASEYLDARHLLLTLPSGRLPEIRALLLERLGQHQEALRLYVHTLRSPALAEAYCDRMYESALKRQSNDGQTKQYGGAPLYDMYLALIQVYLERPDSGDVEGDIPESSNWYQVAELLGRKHRIIEPLHALQLVPEQVSLRSMLAFIEGALRSGGEQCRNTAIVKSLRRSENFQIREENVRCKQKSFLVTFERACSICHRRIGTAAFVAYPDSRLAHYSCYKRTELLNQGSDTAVQ